MILHAELLHRLLAVVICAGLPARNGKVKSTSIRTRRTSLKSRQFQKSLNFDEAKSWTRQTKGNKQAASEVSPIKVEEVPVDEVRVLEFVRTGAARGMLGMLTPACSAGPGRPALVVVDHQDVV